MISLHLSTTEIQSPALSVGWCLTREGAARVEALRAEGKKPVVVLATAPVGDAFNFRLEWRSIARVDDLVGFVEFRRPGANRVAAFLVEDKCECWAIRSGGVYNTTLLHQSGHIAVSPMLLAVDAVLVDVPAAVFAKPPPAWESRWVNWLHRYPPEDQCAYRRRRVLAYTVKPVVGIWAAAAVLLFALITTISLPFFAVTRSGIPARRVLRLAWTGRIRAAADAHGEGEPRSLSRLPSRAGSALGILAFGAWLFAIGPRRALAVVALMLLLIGGMNLASRIADRAKKRRRAAIALLLVCDGVRISRVSDLPPAARTIRLRYLDLKARVCRPFARGG